MVRTFQTPKIFERMSIDENIMVGACKTTRTGLVCDLLYYRTRAAEMRRSRPAERVADDFELAGDLPPARCRLDKGGY